MSKINQVKLKQDADAAERAGRLDKAIDALKQLVEENPRDWNTVNRIGDLYAKLGNTKAANEQHVKVARFLADDGFYLKAIALWKKVLRNDASMLDGHMSLGDLYARQGLPAEAKQTFAFVYEEYKKRDKLSEAGEILRRMAEVDPSDMNVRIGLADLYARDGAAEKAAGEYCAIANELVKQGLVAEAQQQLEKAMKTVPQSPRLLVASARVCFVQKDYAKAGGLLEEAHRTAPANREVALLAEIYARESNPDKAADEILHRMAEVDPSDTPKENPVAPQQPRISRIAGMPVKLGELLLRENMVSPQQLQEALSHQKLKGGKLGKAFVALGFVKDEEITSLLSRHYGVPSVDLDHFEVDPTIIKIIPAETARKYQVLPLSRSGATLAIAMANPTNVLAMDDIKYMTCFNVEPLVASEGALEVAIDRYYGSRPSPKVDGSGGPAGGAVSLKEVLDAPTLSVDDMAAVGGLSEIDINSMVDAEADVKADEDEIDLGNLAKWADEAPIVKLTNALLVDSLRRGASDIHIEPYEKEFRVRFRIDGILYNVMALPLGLKDSLTSRIKSMTKLDMADKRHPQCGRIGIRMKVADRSRELDFRVSVLPTLWGEKIVMRLLDSPRVMLDLSALGFERLSLERFKNAICKRTGMVLVTGPAGSGRTRTLYSALVQLNTPQRNIMTAEYDLGFLVPGFNQVLVGRTNGPTHAQVLGSLMFQDADVILVEHVDEETRELTLKLAARAGHLVLAGMYETDAASAVETLLRAGRDPVLVARALNAVVARRLVRLVCQKCGTQADAESLHEILISMGCAPDEARTYHPVKGSGCSACAWTGYRGRVGLFEVLEVSEAIRQLIKGGAGTAEIRRQALLEGMISLRMSGLEKIKQGITTIEEVLRETA